MEKKKTAAIGGGLALGAINGLFGGGGGMLAVPLLKSLGYGTKQAHATAILIIAPLCAVSAINYIVNGYIDLTVIIPAMLGNVAGGLLGAKIMGKLNSFWVGVAFVVVMAVAGIRTVIG